MNLGKGDPPDTVEVAKENFRKEGRAAAAAKLPRESNPYDVRCMARGLWFEGYDEGGHDR